jgi:hypothetical protein
VFYIPRVTTFALGALLAPAADHGAPDAARGFEPPDDTILAEAVFVGTVLDVWESGGRAIARFVVECAGMGTRVGEVVGVMPGTSAADAGPGMRAGARWMIVTRRISGAS